MKLTAEKRGKIYFITLYGVEHEIEIPLEVPRIKSKVSNKQKNSKHTSTKKK
jgi:hypothetical protein